jgi:hypothetical protein
MFRTVKDKKIETSLIKFTMYGTSFIFPIPFTVLHKFHFEASWKESKIKQNLFFERIFVTCRELARRI